MKDNRSFAVIFDKVLGLAEDAISCIALLVMTGSVVISVVMRYCLRIPNMAGEEFSRFVFVLVCFLGLSIGVRERKHMGVTMFVDRTPEIVHKMISLFVDIVCIIVFAFMTIMGWRYVQTSLSPLQLSTAMRIPMAAVYCVMATGFSLSLLRSVVLFWNDYISKKHPLGVKDTSGGGEELL